jgi:hypothetical protein
MVKRTARTLWAGLILLVLAGAHPAACDGWSLPNPFSTETKTSTKKKPVTKLARKEPSLLDKVGVGTKDFFNRTGETLGLKKPEPKKYGYATAVPPKIQPAKKMQKKSWLSGMFQAEEPKKPKTVSEWMDNKRLDP